MQVMKYVMNRAKGKFLLIPLFMNHSEVHGDWTSAGFVSFKHKVDEYGDILITPTCYGRSESLGLKSAEGDTSYLETALASRY